MLVRERKVDEVVYKCNECDKTLAELIDSGEVVIRGNCKHFKWVEVSDECYYHFIPGCGRKYIEWLKENYILKLDEPGTVNLLVQRQS